METSKTQENLIEYSEDSNHNWQDISFEEEIAFLADQPTDILPIVRIVEATKEIQDTTAVNVEGQIAVLRNLIKSSGIYVLSSVAPPLVSLVIAPFLTHNLSPSQYGILTIVNTAISLWAGITQFGLSSAFFRTYNYDYTDKSDKNNVLSTTTALLFISSIAQITLFLMFAPILAQILLGQSSLSNLVILAGAVVLVQNLAVPGMAWLRAENRPLSYSLLAVGNLLITLVANILLIGLLHWEVTGAVLASGAGYMGVAILTVPIIFLRTGIKIRKDIARSLLTFGLPLVFSLISYWVLQLSDRYLLSLFASLAETAKYAVVYTLGAAMSTVVIGPFTLAWPTAMYAIAKRKDAKRVFSLVFRWFGMFLLLAAFSFSLVGTFLLYWLFPVAYHASALIIPVISISIAFYGTYYIFTIGISLTRKTWIASISITIAAISNVLLNLFLIPFYGAMGAAVSTLIAYLVLAASVYFVNQRLYPITFEIGRFTIALLIGVSLYTGCSFIAPSPKTWTAWGIYGVALILYTACLALLVKLPAKKHTQPGVS